LKSALFPIPNNNLKHNLISFFLLAVFPLALTVITPANVYAQDCTVEVTQLNLEIKELEVRTDSSYLTLKNIPESSLGYKLFFDIWKSNSEILRIKKDLLRAAENGCKNSVPGNGKKPIVVEEDDGQEMDLAATLSVTKQSSKYLIKVDSNIASGSFSLIATKKGSRPISFKVVTDDAGSYALRTSRNLKGFLLVLRYNAEMLDKIQVN
jgi:hypothetical protein